MAITRCPYCHAIIDEADKYCNNCGTQLLFSEDEGVEEEIPGEKIVDAEVEEKDYTVDEPESEKRQRPAPAKDLDAEIDEDLEEELPEGTAKTAIEELMAGEELEDEEGEPPEEVILVDEIEASGARGEADEMKAAGPKTEDTAEEVKEELAAEVKDGDDEVEELEEDLEDGIGERRVKGPGEAVKSAEDETREYGSAPLPKADEAGKAPAEAPSHPGAEEPEIEYVAESGIPDEAATAGEASLRPVTFDTQELENLGRTVDLGREKIDQFIESMAAKTAETGTVPAEPVPVAGPAPTPEAEAGPEKAPEPPTGTLPPWASTMKGAPVFLEETGPLGAPKVRGESATPDTEEVEIFPRRRGSDSTIGLPEKVSQAPLPFGAPVPEDEEEEELEQRREEAAGEEGAEELAEEQEARAPVSEEAAAPAGPVRPPRETLLPVRDAAGRSAQAEILPGGEIEEPAPGPPFSISVFFKSKVFDVLFVGLFWLVALWLAASSMDVTLFDILGSMSGSMMLLYAVFVLLYFFLFKFFLGETLGDRLFRSRERE